MKNKFNEDELEFLGACAEGTYLRMSSLDDIIAERHEGNADLEKIRELYEQLTYRLNLLVQGK